MRPALDRARLKERFCVSGTLINVVAILIGSLIGIGLGNRFPARMQETILNGLGLVTLVVGMQNALTTGNILIPLFSVLIGAIIGEALDMDGAITGLGGWLQTHAARLDRNVVGSPAVGDRSPAQADRVQAARVRFISGFVTASLLFAIGPLATLGPIQNGINPADIKLLAIKSTLDFFASIAFASTLGIGVAFAALPTFVLQGAFALIGVVLANALTASGSLNGSNLYIRELTATGGLILLGISLILLNIKPIRIANLLPALLIAPLLIFAASLLHIVVYPVT